VVLEAKGHTAVSGWVVVGGVLEGSVVLVLVVVLFRVVVVVAVSSPQLVAETATSATATDRAAVRILVRVPTAPTVVLLFAAQWSAAYHAAMAGDEVDLPVGWARDPAFLRAARPILERYASYFRSEVRGFDRVPEQGPFLVVGNHSGGQMPPDIPVLLTAWWRSRGEDEPIYALFHSFFLGLPGVGPAMARAGAIEAGPAAAEAVLRQGAILIDYPGGDREVFRPWNERNRIDFGGRLGFIRLALRTQVPVVPAVSIGAHETVVVLSRGERLSRRLGFDRLFRIKVMPLVLGPPFGIVPGGIPTWPLPSKITVELLEPIDWSQRHGPEAAADETVLRACYEELTSAMQAALDRLAAERRFPIIG
jgi:1-acyl-sn-glycerol-3-phosphate acyltransferase